MLEAGHDVDDAQDCPTRIEGWVPPKGQQPKQAGTVHCSLLQIRRAWLPVQQQAMYVRACVCMYTHLSTVDNRCAFMKICICIYASVRACLHLLVCQFCIIYLFISILKT